ncbi:GNAT family N-acetyltransferase [Deinococcus aquiradiocola]|uniref:GNAT family N-acetyltransferase n=1 Tax=Deinococcus aquiradiocola TaxID=393059 RepID=UPI00166E99B1|nr:GNAT family protein [Deinococcus aquiradiocola]
MCARSGPSHVHPGTVRVVPVHAGVRDAVLALRAHPEQEQFSGRMPDLLLMAEDAPQSEAMAVLVRDADGDEVVIGYYRLDFVLGAVAFRDFGRPTVGLRGYFIGAPWQGRGLGTAATRAMIRDLQERHPGIHLLALSVNVRNPAARAVYARAGFVTDPELYLGGAAGPQHVMLLDLTTANQVTQAPRPD